MIIYNGVNLETEYSCNIFRSDSDASPAREVESVAIAGRSGNLVIDGKRYPNVDMEYTAIFSGESADANAVNMKNFLLSQIGYKELRDNEHPDEFYLAIVSKDIKPVLTKERDKVKMRLTFNRKPQRYLMSGETAYSLIAGEISGNPMYVDMDGVDTSTLSVSISVPYWNGNRKDQYGLDIYIPYNSVSGFYLSVDGSSVYNKNGFTNPRIIEASFDVSTGGTITKIEELLPTTGWSKVSGYSSVYEVSFVPAGTIIACSLLKFYDEPHQWAGSIYYDSQNQKLICFAPANKTTLTDFYSWLNENADAGLIETCSITQTWSDSISLPSGYGMLTAGLNSKYDSGYNAQNISISAEVEGTNTLVNPTLFASKPLIRLYGNGTVSINSQTIIVENSTSFVDIDCDMMDCYEGTTNRNNDVTFSTYDFPTLEPGSNTFISVSGVSGIRVTPRWWRL